MPCATMRSLGLMGEYSTPMRTWFGPGASGSGMSTYRRPPAGSPNDVSGTARIWGASFESGQVLDPDRQSAGGGWWYDKADPPSLRSRRRSGVWPGDLSLRRHVSKVI